jgi:hypothetical protein
MVGFDRDAVQIHALAMPGIQLLGSFAGSFGVWKWTA